VLAFGTGVAWRRGGLAAAVDRARPGEPRRAEWLREDGDSRRRADYDPARADDDDYVDRKYDEVQGSIQRRMDALARKRALPLFG
jgi:hypothetical protein